ncbi:MAG: hypothetical protein NC311_18690, partial [Muribaculaceae bacterium]|nr:hypothetical protein [Muribaculaceae bacterium]
RDTTYIHDVFDNSTLQLKNPVRLDYSGQIRISYCFLNTADATYQITFGEEFEMLGDVNMLGLIETIIPHNNPMKIVSTAPSPERTSSSSWQSVFTEDLAFTRSVNSSGMYFTDPFNRYDANSAKTFRFYPKAFYRAGSNPAFNNNYAIILYDLDNDAFVYGSDIAAASSGPTYCKVFRDNTGEDFKFNNKAYKRTIVYGENDYSNNTGFSNALMKNEDGEYFIYRFRQYQICYDLSKDIVNMEKRCYKVDLSAVPDIDKATNFHFATNFTLLLYSVGNTLYGYDYVNNKWAKKEFDSEIVYLEPEYRSRNNYSEYIVATYNGEKSTIQKMQVSNNSNFVELIEQDVKWDVDMKVVDIVWKQ